MKKCSCCVVGRLRRQVKNDEDYDLANCQTEAVVKCFYFVQMVVTLDQKFYKWGRNAQLIKQAVSLEIFSLCWFRPNYLVGNICFLFFRKITFKKWITAGMPKRKK